MKNRTVLLNPGPVTLSDNVREALIRGDWCHREPEFADLTQSINRRLTEVYEKSARTHAAVLMTGSGTLAVEAMLASFAPASTRTLVLTNGVYGERMATMLQAMGRPMEVVGAGWTEPMDLRAAESLIESDPGITHIVAVHHETTTGRLNDVHALGNLCKQYDKALLLDAVSSFGAEEIHFEEWNLMALAATANKCLHGVPGLSFVIAKQDFFGQPTSECGSVYMDVNRYFHTQHGEGYSPFTLAVQPAFALDAALAELNNDGGWRARRQSYRSRASAVQSALQSAGVQTFIPVEEYSSVMTSFELPDGVEYAVLHDSLKEQGFVIYAGQGDFSKSMFRIANMGDITDDDLERLTSALTAFFA